MGYWWTVHPHGQYVDGHERPNVVNYCQNVFFPAIQELEAKTWKWGRDGAGEGSSDEPHTVLCFHDESTFYGHDCQKTCWVHKSEKVTPYAKGEGHSCQEPFLT